jgi:hypothetical protein
MQAPALQIRYWVQGHSEPHSRPQSQMHCSSQQCFPPPQGDLFSAPAHGLAGAQVPQSAGQVLQVSPLSQLPFPQTGVGVTHSPL